VPEQRLVFGEDPELYDKARAGYPSDLVSAVTAYGGLSRNDQAVEVGAGTGKATLAFARAGLRITAIEPSAEMAAVASRNTAGFPAVSVVISSFEEWDGAQDTYDLVFAAQSWHWIDPTVGYSKAAALLRDGGTLALMWHRTDWSGEPLRDELDSLYREVDPDLRSFNPGFPGLDPPDDDAAFLEQVASAGPFTDVAEQRFPRKDTFSAESFVELLGTQSHHRLLPEERREKLLRGVTQLIERHGGTVEVPHSIWLVMARRRPR